MFSRIFVQKQMLIINVPRFDVPVTCTEFLTCTESKGHCLFVLVSGYVCQIKLYTQLSSPR